MIVTGGAGFIGSNFILEWNSRSTEPIVVIDCLTYAGNLENLASVSRNGRFDGQVSLSRTDLRNFPEVKSVVMQSRPKAIIHFAAESHVDRSIVGPANFIDTNVVGTFNLLQAAYAWWSSLDQDCPERRNFRFLHVSTDEVYGSLSETDPAFTEASPYAPNSPYSASKAASDHLVRAWSHTYGLPTLTTNCSNNYGPFQFPEKLIPLMIRQAILGNQLPVYGDGKNIRDWIYVSDHCNAIRLVLEAGRPGEVYNIGGNAEMTNLEVVHTICDVLNEMMPRRDGRSYREQLEFVKDRPGHDRRYAIDAGKIRQELGWVPEHRFDSGIRKTIQWYLDQWTRGDER